MKKFKYFLWNDPYMGWGVGETLLYINAESEEKARQKLKDVKGFTDTDLINGDVREVNEFIQPEPIEII